MHNAQKKGEKWGKDRDGNARSYTLKFSFWNKDHVEKWPHPFPQQQQILQRPQREGRTRTDGLKTASTSSFPSWRSFTATAALLQVQRCLARW